MPNLTTEPALGDRHLVRIQTRPHRNHLITWYKDKKTAKSDALSLLLSKPWMVYRYTYTYSQKNVNCGLALTVRRSTFRAIRKQTDTHLCMGRTQLPPFRLAQRSA